MKRSFLTAAFLLVTGSIFAQTSLYVDPAWPGTQCGTATQPWTSLGVTSGGSCSSGAGQPAWSVINSDLGTGAVTVYFTACNTACTSSTSTTTQINVAVTATSGNLLKLDGISKYNTSETSPAWTTNFVPTPCTGWRCAEAELSGQKMYTIGPTNTPITTTATFTTCQGFVTVQGFTLIRNANQTANLSYTHDLTFQYNIGTGVSGGSNGPGVFVGPVNSGPCHTGATRPGGTDSGPDNVTVQYNWIHDTYEDCLYIGASTPDPFYTACNGGNSCQQYEGGINQLNLSCGNGCTSNSAVCSTTGLQASTCSTGANYLVRGNTIESCGTSGGTENVAINVKDGHSALVVTGNTIRPTLAGFSSSELGAGINIESGATFSGNYIEAPATNGIQINEGWNNSVGRSSISAYNNIIVDVNNGVGDNNGIIAYGPNQTGEYAWQALAFDNNTFYNVGTISGSPCIGIQTGSVPSAVAIVENNIIDDCNGGAAGFTAASGTLATHSYNLYYQALALNGATCASSETGVVCANPLFTSTSGPPYIDSDFVLQSSSPAATAGTNLSSLFTTDYNGATRPAPSAAWSQGAQQVPSSTSYVYTVEASPGVTVSSSPSGISGCTSTGGVCSASFAAATTVTLTETPSSNYTFKKWAGAGCSTGTTCVYVMNAAQQVAAIAVANFPLLPQTWVNNNEGNAAYQYELALGSTTGVWIIGPPPTCTFTLTNYLTTPTGMQHAVNDAEACRTLTHVGIATDIPPGSYNFTSSQNGLILPQTNTVTSSNFIVLRSSQDSSLPIGTTVCAHGVQDNNTASTDIGLENPDCTGTNMYYDSNPTSANADTGSGTGTNCVQVPSAMVGNVATFVLVGGSGSGCNTVWPAAFVPGNLVQGYNFTPNTYRTYWMILSGGAGTTTFTASSCAFSATITCLSGLAASTANGSIQDNDVITGHVTLSANTTTLLCISATLPTPTGCLPTGTPVLVPLANGYVQPGLAYAVGTGVNAETVTPVSGTNQIGMYATFTKSHAFGTSVTFCAAGCPYTLANGTVINTANYNDLQYMWQINGTSGYPVVACSPVPGQTSTSSPPACGGSTTIGPDHWLIEDLSSSMPPGNNQPGYAFALARTGNETAATQFPAHVHIRKSWIHGDWGTIYAGANDLTDGLEWYCIYCSLVDSQLSQILRPLGEGHAIGCQGSQLKLDHNWIEGASSACISGGYSGGSGPSSVVGTFSTTYIPFTDVEERRNHITYPFTWLGLSPVPAGINPNFASSFSTQRKGGQENKSGVRMLESGNYYENADPAGGTYAFPRAYNTRNNSGGPLGTWYNVTINDVTAQNNIYRHTCVGNGISKSDQSGGNGGGVGNPSLRISFLNDLWYDISVNSHPWCFNFTDKFAAEWDSGSQMGWTGNYVCDSTGYNCTFTAINSLVAGGPVATATGAQVFNLSIGDAAQITGCTVTALNNATTTFGAETLPVLGYTVIVPSAQWNGTYSTSNSTVVLNGTGSAQAGLSDTSGTCTMTNVQGSPEQLNMNHNTIVNDEEFTFNNSFNLSTANAAPYMLNGSFQNSILLGGSLGGWFYHALSPGTPSIQFMTDTSSLTDDHLVWPAQTASNYTGGILGNNPIYPVASPVNYFPATSYCTGPTPSINCVGFVNAMSLPTGPMPLNAADYHTFALIIGSSFKAGGSDQASDGTDQGAIMSAIDAAQTQNLFVCTTPCGSPGPYPDNPTAQPTITPVSRSGVMLSQAKQ